MDVPEDIQQELLTRLRRIEGQARGVQRMVEEKRDCAEIIQQLSSIRAATQSATLFLLKHHARECSIRAVKEPNADKSIEKLIELVLSVS